MNFQVYNFIAQNFNLIINTIYAGTVVFILLLILFENRNPIKSISWILVITLLPVIGVVLYFFFGQEYRKEKRYSKKEMRYRKQLKTITNNQLKQLSSIDSLTTNEAIKSKAGIMHLLLQSDNAFISNNNAVEILKNGSATFDELKKCLQQAESFIHMEFYILKFDKVGREIFEILIEKAKAGIEVKVIYDSVGSYHMNQRYKARVKKAGIEIQSFQKVIIPFLSSKVNYRNHRKIVVIDGKTGFTGGINIAERYNEKISTPFWRDTFVKIEGSSVNALEGIFHSDWFYVSKESLFDKKYFTTLPESQNVLTQIISSGPESKMNSITQLFFSIINSSTKYVYITSPYFIPNEEISYAIQIAALRGIDVRILMPKKSDSVISQFASRSYINEMLKSGVKIYFYDKGFVHSKLIMSDDIICSIGSANFDYRSLETNFEVNAVFYNEKLILELKQQFFDDLKNAHGINIQTWKKRPIPEKIFTSIAHLFAPLF